MKKKEGDPNLIKKDCILWRTDLNGQFCHGLRRLYCAVEPCSFYKSSKLYNRNGTIIEGVTKEDIEKSNNENRDSYKKSDDSNKKSHKKGENKS